MQHKITSKVYGVTGDVVILLTKIAAVMAFSVVTLPMVLMLANGAVNLAWGLGVAMVAIRQN